ncbi:DUF3488 and transglutaminase-like domain-containing protein [Protofrankia coriariae]|uniref:Transglutaminase-like domain-containing protein n=1 Tax=Protofrankia coriariae TaxID=1562887 RepID=A0ABR5F3R7_9ACTN|nr:transglutaminase domain-containing protein [Protofrankia coriariae]KLL11323.1 hypothetical protein FrCorBMG51_11920 [Protofrankia coriariae]
MVLTWLIGTLAGGGFGPVFGGVPGSAAFLLAVGSSTTVAFLAALAVLLRPRLSAATAGLAGSAAVALTAALATGTGAGVVHGPWDLLTAALPADPGGPALASVALLTGWTTLAACLLAAYNAGPLVRAVPPLVTLLAALALGASVEPLPAWYGPVLVGLGGVLVLTGRRPRPGGLILAVVPVVLAVLAAVTLGPHAPGARLREPLEAQAFVQAPVQPRSGVSPLQQYLALRDDSRPLRITGTVSRPGSLLRMATLTRFNGRYWTVDGDFRRAGTTLSDRADSAEPDTTRRIAVTQQIHLAVGDPDWLPVAGRPTRMSVTGLAVDGTTGDLAVPTGGTAPRDYSATSTILDARADEVLTDEPAAAPEPRIPDPPQLVRTFIDNTIAGKPRGSAQLLALYQQFTNNSELAGGRKFSYDQAEKVAGGHGYYQIQRLLEDRRGTSEQYASAYAAMARWLGFDARVVMGFRPEYDGNSFVATGRDVDAWVEVRFARLGWVTLDPSPRDNPIGSRQDPAPLSGQNPQADDPLKKAGATAPPPSATGGTDLAKKPATAPARPSSLLRAVLTSIAVVLLVLLIPTVVPVAKALRRARRRRDPSARRVVLGAWWETLDRLREAGIPATPLLTTGEVVQLADHLPRLRPLAGLVDQAGYAPETPAPGQQAEAWAISTVISRQLHIRMSVSRRIHAFFDPRPLWYGPRPHVFHHGHRTKLSENKKKSTVPARITALTRRSG